MAPGRATPPQAGRHAPGGRRLPAQGNPPAHGRARPGADRGPRPVTRDDTGDDTEDEVPRIRDQDRAASGVPSAGWALGDRFAWDEIQQRLMAAAEEEIDSTNRELFFSGFTAGFAIVLTFIGYAVGTAHFPGNPFLAALLYPVGFMYIILGRYELFTENTLPPVKLVLTRMASLPLLLQMWTVVLAANILGAAAGAYVLANTHVLETTAMHAGAGFALEGLQAAWWDVFWKAVFAGWLVAGVVWLGTAAQDTISRVLVVYVVFYTIAVTELRHVVTAASEASFFVFFTGADAVTVFVEFWLPVLLGNIFGGVVVVALGTYAQAEHQRFPEARVLGNRELLLSMEGGRPFQTPRPADEFPAEKSGAQDAEPPREGP